MNRVLLRQLKRLGLDPDDPPEDPEAWMIFLERIESTYDAAKTDRYYLERSLEISSKEMRALYEDLRKSSASEVAAERDKLQKALKEMELAKAKADSLNEDLTKQTEIANELRKKAESANAAKSSFLANMSHEIRSPMNAVIGMTDLLKNTNLDDEQMDFVSTIEKSGNALLEVINDILDFSKIEAGSMHIEEDEFELMPACLYCIDLVAHAASRKGLLVKNDLSADLPARVFGDEPRVKQVLINLLTNAVKFTETGSVRIGSTVHSEKDGCVRIVFEVSDTGIGIADSAQESLFDAFQQADNSITRKFGGTGLGLAISRRIARLMGGDVTVKSVLGEGSTFTFSCALKKNANVFEKQTLLALENMKRPGISKRNGHVVETNSGASVFSNLYPLSVLIVEDNAVNQKVIKIMIEKLGYSPDLCTNGQEAIEFLQRTRYDLVLMDLQMPVMGGIEATRHIREHFEKDRQPFISALTANAVIEDQVECQNANMDHFVAKPVRLSDIKKVIKVAHDSIRAGK